MNIINDVSSPTTMQSVKLVVLGSESSGKSSLIRQFVFHEFFDEYEPTKRKEIYYSTVSVNNERLLELKIVDVPTIFEFPTNNEDEWDSGLTSFGLRNADVYLLVFDASSANSFKFMKLLRDQILTNRPDSLIIVAGNKHDLVVEANTRQRQASLAAMQNKSKLTLTNSAQPNQRTDGGAIFHRKLTKKFASTVRKQWRNAYVECSAKYNWRVTTVFRELIKIVGQNSLSSNDCNAKRKVSLANLTSLRLNSNASNSTTTEQRTTCKIQ